MTNQEVEGAQRVTTGLAFFLAVSWFPLGIGSSKATWICPMVSGSA